MVIFSALTRKKEKEFQLHIKNYDKPFRVSRLSYSDNAQLFQPIENKVGVQGGVLLLRGSYKFYTFCWKVLQIE